MNRRQALGALAGARLLQAGSFRRKPVPVAAAIPAKKLYLPSAVIAASQGIFGTQRLVSGYSGNCFDLRRGDNTTASFGFASGSDQLDSAAIIAWNALNSGGASRLYITKWYDQSGLGNHLIQATTNVQPCLELNDSQQGVPTQPADEIPCVYFNNPGTPTLTSGYLSCATGSFASNRNFSCLSVLRINDLNENQQNGNLSGVAFQLGQTSGADCSIYDYSASVNTASPITPKFVRLDSTMGGTFPTSGTTRSIRMPNTNLCVRSWKGDGSALTMRIGNWLSVNATSIGTLVSSLTGFRVGRAGGTSFTSCAVVTGLVFASALGSTDEQSAMDALATAWGFSNSPRALIATDGDSITAAHLIGTWPNRCFSWFRSVQQNTPNCVFFNLAQDGGWIGKVTTPWGALPGEGAGTASVQKGGEATDSLDPLLNGSYFPSQILIVWMGRNDITLYGPSAAAGYGTLIYNELVTYCQARRAAGWKVVVCDAIPGDDMNTGTPATTGNMETERLAFNALMAANWRTFADRFVQHSALNWTPSGSFAANYQDGVHPNATGQALAAAAIQAQVNTLL